MLRTDSEVMEPLLGVAEAYSRFVEANPEVKRTKSGVVDSLIEVVDFRPGVIESHGP
jgi:hypothetical protein